MKLLASGAAALVRSARRGGDGGETMRKRQVLLRMPDHIHAAIKDRADHLGVSMHAFILMAVGGALGDGPTTARRLGEQRLDEPSGPASTPESENS